MWYKVDFKKVTLFFVPITLRKKGMLAWLEALTEPFRTIQYEFEQKREDAWYNLRHNGQVCLLRKVLNDKFDAVQRRITILDGNQFRRLYIYTEPELKTKYLGSLVLYQDVDYEDTAVDFIVQIPLESYVEHEVESLLNYYKLASKRYKIEKI